MKINDIITLVKAGYSPAEIGALENRAETVQLVEAGIKKEDIPAYLELAKDDPAPEPEPVKPSEPEPEPEDPTDYKEKYQQLLKQTQEKATRENMQKEKPNSDEILADIVKSFM